MGAGAKRTREIRIDLVTLVPVARTSPGSRVWMELTHSMHRGILWAMSLVLKFCLSVSFTQSLTCNRCGSRTSSAVTSQGPMGAKVSRDFVW